MMVPSSLWLSRASLVLGISIIVLGLGCVPDKRSTDTVITNTSTTVLENADWQIVEAEGELNTTLNASELAVGLMNDVDVLGMLWAIRPQPVQFNDKLDENIADDSEFFIARQWWDELTGSIAFENSMTKYLSATMASSGITELASGKTPFAAEVAVGDSQATYYEPATADRPASLTYRFTVGQYGVRLTVLARSDEAADVTTLVEELGPSLDVVAVAQYNKIVQLIYAPTVDVPTNDAIKHLPATLPDATVLGTATVNFIEWYGATYDLESDEFPGYTSGGLRRFQLDARLDEVVEVTVIEMATAEQASKFVADLLPSLPDSKEIILPDTLADNAAAVDSSGLLELQAAKNNYVIDVTILAPFGEMDAAAAEADLIALSETIVINFVD